MKKKEPVLAAVIGWVAGPFTFVYLGSKKTIKALIELILILAIIYFTHYLVAVPFVLGYAYAGYLACLKQNREVNKQNKRNN